MGGGGGGKELYQQLHSLTAEVRVRIHRERGKHRQEDLLEEQILLSEPVISQDAVEEPQCLSPHHKSRL